MSNKRMPIVFLLCCSILVSCNSEGNNPEPKPTPASTTYNFVFYDGRSTCIEVPEGKDVKDYYPANTPKHDNGYIEYTYTWEYKQNYSYQEQQHETKISVEYLFNCADGRKIKIIVPRGHDIEEYKSSISHSEEKIDIGQKIKTIYTGWKESGPTSFDETGYSIKIYKITYSGLDSLTTTVTNPNPTWVEENKKYTLKNAEGPGYKFNGWFDDETDGNLVNTIETNTDLTIFAHTEVIPYTISYELNGGTLAGGDITEYNVETPTVSLKNPSKNEYGFEGWYLKSDFSDNSITGWKSGEMTGDKTLYAKWSGAITYTIHYPNIKETDINPNPIGYTVESNTITLSNVTRDGYNFIKWHKDSIDGDRIVTIPKGSTGDLYLYAEFSEPIEYIITYINGDILDTNPNPSTYTVESNIITLQAATKKGYTFNKWRLGSSSGNQITCIIPSEHIGGISLYCEIPRNTYTITYHLDGGTQSDNPSSYNVDDNIELNNPTKQFNFFNGWYFDSNKTQPAGTGWDAGKKTGNINLYADWKAKATLEEYTWEEISAVSEMGIDEAKKRFGEPGEQTKRVQLKHQDINNNGKIDNGEVYQTVRIIDYGADIDPAGNTLNITFEFSDLISDANGHSLGIYYGDLDSGVCDRYENSTIRKSLNGAGGGKLYWFEINSKKYSTTYKTKDNIYSMLPSSLSSALKIVRKSTPIYSPDWGEINIDEKVFILSSSEMNIKVDRYKHDPYTYYKNCDSKKRIKHQAKWNDEATLVTPLSGNYDEFDGGMQSTPAPGYQTKYSYAGYNNPNGVDYDYGSDYWTRTIYIKFIAPYYIHEGVKSISSKGEDGRYEFYGNLNILPIAPAFCI